MHVKTTKHLFKLEILGVVFVQILFLWNSLKLLSDINLSHFISFQNCDPGQWVMMNIEDNVNESEFYEISELMEKTAVKYDLQMIQLRRTQVIDGVTESTLFVTTNEASLSKYIYLNNALIENFSDSYSSDLSQNYNQKIFSFFDSRNVLKIEPFSSNLNFGGLIYFHGPEEILNSVEKLVSDIQELYPQFDCVYQPMTYSNPIEFSVFDNGLIWLFISVVVALIFNVAELKDYRRISLLKIEGMSSRSIYCNLYLRKDLVRIFLVVIISFLILCGFMCKSAGFSHLLKILVQINFIGWTTFGCVRALLLLWIHKIPSYESIKGVNQLNLVVSVLLPIKAILSFFILIQLYPFMTNVKNIIQLNAAYPEALSKTNQLFIFGNQIKSNWFEDIGNENFVDLYNALQEEVGIFRCSLGQFDIEKNGEFHQAIIANDALLRMIGIDLSDFDDNSILIFYSQDFKDDISKWKHYFENEYLTTATQIEIIQIDQPIPVFTPRLLLSNESVDLMLRIPVEQQFRGQVNGHLFYYAGNAKQAERLIAEIFISYGYSPAFEINSVQETVKLLYGNRLTVLSDDLILFVMQLVVYYEFAVFMSLIDNKANGKKYRLLYIEGNSQLALVVQAQIYSVNVVAFIIAATSGLIDITLPFVIAVVIFIGIDVIISKLFRSLSFYAKDLFA